MQAKMPMKFGRVGEEVEGGAKTAWFNKGRSVGDSAAE
jgi:hypothetical protein